MHKNITDYREEDYLQISGLQHFRFCRRQWALIHIEKLWAENYRTVDGELMHEHVHDAEFNESRGNVIIRRGVYVHSAELGISGQCDALEFHKGSIGVPMRGKEGLWQPYPVEYKRGEFRTDTGDTLQLCAQAMCLEHMLCCKIERGALFYGMPRRRMEITFTDELRKEVLEAIAEMHDMYSRGYTPKVKPTKSARGRTGKTPAGAEAMGLPAAGPLSPAARGHRQKRKWRRSHEKVP